MAVTNPIFLREHGGQWYFKFDTPEGERKERWRVGAGGGTPQQWLSQRAIALQNELETNELTGLIQRVEEGKTGLWLAQNPVNLPTNAGGINHAIAAALIRWMMRLGTSPNIKDQFDAVFVLAMIEDLIDHIKSQGWSTAQIAGTLNITVPQLGRMNSRVEKLTTVRTISPTVAIRDYLLDAEDWE